MPDRGRPSGRSRARRSAAGAGVALGTAAVIWWAMQRPAIPNANPLPPGAAPARHDSEHGAVHGLAPPPVVVATRDGEARSMATLRTIVDRDPSGALQLCEQLARDFPARAAADERLYLTLRARVGLGDIPGARADARAFYERFPDSPWGHPVERLTGVHPPPYQR